MDGRSTRPPSGAGGSSDYWSREESLALVLRYLAAVAIDHWREDAVAARLVAGAVENDQV